MDNEYIVQKSKFLVSIFPCEQEKDALDAISSVRRAHPQATHHCYAYIIGANEGIMRYSDDGEPSGTAGLPILGILRNNGLVNICAIVTRYFGGILLGTGGLVRSYSHSCALGLQKVRIVTNLPTQRMTVDIPYPLWDKIQYFIDRKEDIQIEEINYGVSVTLSVFIKEDAVSHIVKELTDMVNGELDFILSDSFFHCWETPKEQIQE